MRATLTPIASALLLGLAACTATEAPPRSATASLAPAQMHTAWGSGPLAYPTSIYDPALLNDPSMLEDQPHNRGNKGGTPPLR